MISHPSTSGRQRTVEFQALPSQAGQVRRIVSAQLRYWKLDALVGPASSGVAELLCDVHRQAGPDRRCTVEIALCLGELTISVRDEPCPPSGRPAGFLAGGFLAGGYLAGGVRGARRDDADRAVRLVLPVPSRTTASDVPAEPREPAGTARDAVRAAQEGPPPSSPPAPEPLPRPDGSPPRSPAPAPVRTAVRTGGQAPARPV